MPDEMAIVQNMINNKCLQACGEKGTLVPSW